MTNTHSQVCVSLYGRFRANHWRGEPPLLDALELANGGKRVTFGLSKSPVPVEFAKEQTRGTPGRKPKVPEEFVAYAGALWGKAISRAGNNVPDDQLREIA